MSKNNKIIKVLGIDPSLNSTGLSVIEFIDSKQFKFVYGEAIKVDPKSDYVDKIITITNKIKSVINKYDVKEAAMEETFLNKNPKSSLKLGMVRGSCIAICGQLGIKIQEHTVRTIKKTITGNGAADKTQVEYMVSMILNLKKDFWQQQYDITDALSVAINHCLMKK